MELLRKRIKKIISESLENDTKFIPLNLYVGDSDKNDIWNIKQLLNDNNYKMYIVGGAVRDGVKNAIKLNKNPMDSTVDIPKDFDLATDAPPEKIKEIFYNAPFVHSILNIGESFAIQFLLTKNGNRYELATFRSDVGGGRKPDSVAIETSPQKDAQRRDLTINALFYDIKKIINHGFSGNVIDYVGGVNDIKNNIINTVGNPFDRFNEDPLRKIRTIRFASRTNSKIPQNVKNAILDGNTSLVDPTGKKVSNERIKDEFYKGIKSSKSVINFLSLLEEFNFMKHIFGRLKINLNNFIEEKNPIILISNLLKGNSLSDVEKVLFEKKYSTDEINSIKFLLSLLSINEQNVSVIKRFYLQKVKNSKIIINEKNYSLSNDDIYKFCMINNIDNNKIKNFFKLADNFVQPSELLKSIGYEGQDLGKAISRLEIEYYKNPEKTKEVIDSNDKDKINKLIFLNNFK